ncbi:DUF4403 family protein [Flavobacterium sp. ANB]|uniref:DUF4403 family protein n=1 Tax=unclassified Flavobacterium TaxID=196869 RepID=UPI0012B84935|nr:MULTISPECIES: DUF4403 family protein [unclassified Flavobacterium]MBF4518209.1 DUF4403 family protein [Flavobacterium sp. ANB]MTD71093.1 DUF4403 family protein [Flavobacterium sp. LC2016-13]
MKTTFILYPILVVAIVFTSCKSYDEITKKPERLSENVELPPYESSFALALKVDLSSLESKLNDALKNGYSNSDEGTFEYRSWIKTKDPFYDPNKLIKTRDPLYHPNEWIKTKDPLYNPKKWLKGPFGWKTKNPLYHPNEWFKTKDPLYNPNEWIETNNPLYHPNEWIETKGPAVAVGYKYDIDLKLKEKITLSYVDDNTLRISVPISFNGSVGLKGVLAGPTTLNKKNFDGEIQFFVNTSFSITPDWCPNIGVNVTHSWISNPQIEIMDNVYISLTGMTDKHLKEIEKDVSNLINQQVKCDMIRDVVKDKWKYYGVSLPALANGKQYQLNINPSKVALSGLKVYKDTLALYVGIKGNVSFNDNIVNTTSSLPLLEEQTQTASEVKAFLPLLIKYDDIEYTANQYLKEKDVVLKPDIVLKKKAKVKLIEMTFYPNADEVVVGVKLKAKLPGNLLPVSGWVYLTGKPVMTNNKKFELQDLDFSMTVDNKFYPTIATLFKPLIINEIKKQTTRDFTDSIANIKKKLIEKSNSFQHDDIGFSIKDVDFGIYDIILDKEEIAIVTEFNSKFDIFLKSKKEENYLTRNDK